VSPNPTSPDCATARYCWSGSSPRFAALRRASPRFAALRRASPRFAALRRSELAVLTVDQITDHDRGLVTGIARSKTNQTGLERELVVLPRTARPPGGRLSRARSQAAEPLQSLAVERGAPLGRGDHLGLVGAPADLLADRASRVAAGTGS
jgi:hypothetical protein